MADKVLSKVVTGADGASTVSTGGLNLAQILKVSRQGEQKDYTGILSVGAMEGKHWTFLSFNKRIAFGTSFPFLGNEVIHIIYKVAI